ncbi:UMP kinase [Candidatus Gottesmanbacteria bacterium]|nr:UMP kinase [Candidatus Gottesmanbacteria bacterium]
MPKTSKAKVQNIMLSLRGSVVFPPSGINKEFLNKFNEFIRKQIANTKRRFFIFVGGGFTNDYYQEAAKKVIGRVKADDLDWIGIRATKLNAHLIRTIFRDIAHPVIVEDYDRKPQINGKRIVVCAGWQPGWNTDFDMVLFTKIFPTEFAVSLCKVDYIYDKDPEKFKDAKPLTHINWPDYIDIFGDKREQGREIPFDPIAAKLAQQLRQKAYVVNGSSLDNLANLFDGGNFKGTLIEGRKYEGE